MDTIQIKSTIINLLKKDDRIWNEEKTELNQTLLLDLIDKIDEKLINLLLQEKETRNKFFVKIKDVYVFKTNDFKFFMEENKVDNSYTAYKNSIGLTDGKRFLKDTEDVVLDFPYKDCVLEGGQSTEEGTDTYFEYSKKEGKYEEKQAPRKEIFFNQVLAKDEIDRLEDEKAFVNWKRFTKDGEQDVKEIKRDEEGTIKDNLIIKGNNLLTLHSLKQEFQGKVKLIYIDPPFNRDADVFYNDNFKKSTWLTFMKNRLEIAKILLSEKGVIFVHIDNNELAHLKVLMDEVFLPNNFLQIISVKKATTAGFKSINLCPTTVTEYILMYSKNRNEYYSKPYYVEVDYDEDYGKVIINPKDNPEKWKLISLDEIIIKQTPFSDWGEAKKKWGSMWKEIRKGLKAAFAFENRNIVVSTKDLHKPSDEIKKVMEKSKIDRERVFVYKRKEKNDIYAINGRIIAFYAGKFKKINGEEKPAELLTNFWNDISWYGIANEGGVTLKNSKKPEKLLHRIIDMTTEKGDLVLDYHLGSGTTCAVAHKMGRQYIGIEQLNYKENDSVIRLKNVIKGDQSGISKAVNWKEGGEFIYCELAKWNELAKEEINNCKSLKELGKLFDVLYEKYFLNYNLKIKEFKEKVIKEVEFQSLSLNEQKKMFLTMLDLNQMYVQKTEMADKRFGVDKKDQKLTLEFYGGED